MDGALLDGAFLIGGHGAEEPRDRDNDMIVVPDNCIIVVLMHYGELMPRGKLLEIHQRLYQLKEEGRSDILHDPLNHIPTLLEICGSLAIYQAGDTCPNFDYELFDCSATECFNSPVGVINLDTWSKPPKYLFQNTLRKSASPSQIIDHFSSPYQDSIYPTKAVIEDTVKEVIAQSNAPMPFLRKIYQEIKKKSEVTLSDILDFRKNEFHKRVYYHGLCRYKKDVTEALRSIINHKRPKNERKAPPVKRHPAKTIPSLQEDIKQIERLPLWVNDSNPRAVSHTSNGKNRAITLKKKVIGALKHRIGETVKHRTPHIKPWMNSPEYHTRRRKEVRQDIYNIAYYIRNVMHQIKVLENGITDSKTSLTLDLTPAKRALIEGIIKENQSMIIRYNAQLQSLHRQYNNMIKWEKSMDALPLPPSPPISYLQENKRWKSDQENTAPENDPHRHIIEAERYGKRHVRHSYANQRLGDMERLQRMREGPHMESDAKRNAESKSLEYLNHAVLPVRGSINDREQLQRMREAHARFKKGRNEYMEEANSKSNDYEKNMAYMTNEIKGYERGIKQLEYVTNVVPPFHTSRVKIDKNKQLQTMRNAHARFTSSRKKYMEDKASASDTHQYKKNMNYFNRILRDYEKGIHQAEQPSNSYRRVTRDGTVKWIRK
jgi:hypothetical protein